MACEIKLLKMGTVCLNGTTIHANAWRHQKLDNSPESAYFLSPLPHWTAPHAFEVGAISDLQQDVFGPVLHIVRWRAMLMWAMPASTAARLARWWGCSGLAVKV